MSNVAISDAKWFGGGFIYGIQQVAPGGVAPSLLYPGQFSTIQEASVDISKTVKELRGVYEDPEDLADASRKITGKVTSGRININQLNNLVFGEPGGTNFITGTTKVVDNEAGTVNGSNQVIVVNSGVFLEDLGVTYAGTREQLIPVSSVSSQGQYSVASGVYTFNAADSAAKVLISYRYTSASGHSLSVNNLLMGNQRPSFSVLLTNQYDGDNELLLYYCKATKVSMAIKTEDYVHLEMDFMAGANSSGQTFQWLTSY